MMLHRKIEINLPNHNKRNLEKRRGTELLTNRNEDYIAPPLQHTHTHTQHPPIPGFTGRGRLKERIL